MYLLYIPDESLYETYYFNGRSFLYLSVSHLLQFFLIFQYKFLRTRLYRAYMEGAPLP